LHIRNGRGPDRRRCEGEKTGGDDLFPSGKGGGSLFQRVRRRSLGEGRVRGICALENSRKGEGKENLSPWPKRRPSGKKGKEFRVPQTEGVVDPPPEGVCGAPIINWGEVSQFINVITTGGRLEGKGEGPKRGEDIPAF